MAAEYTQNTWLSDQSGLSEVGQNQHAAGLDEKQQNILLFPSSLFEFLSSSLCVCPVGCTLKAANKFP